MGDKQEAIVWSFRCQNKLIQEKKWTELNYWGKRGNFGAKYVKVKLAGNNKADII